MPRAVTPRASAPKVSADLSISIVLRPEQSVGTLTVEGDLIELSSVHTAARLPRDHIRHIRSYGHRLYFVQTSTQLPRSASSSCTIHISVEPPSLDPPQR